MSEYRLKDIAPEAEELTNAYAIDFANQIRAKARIIAGESQYPRAVVESVHVEKAYDQITGSWKRRIWPRAFQFIGGLLLGALVPVLFFPPANGLPDIIPTIIGIAGSGIYIIGLLYDA